MSVTSLGGQMMMVTELAKRADVTPDVVRYYARIGLLKPARHPDSGYKQFTETDVKRLQFIRRSRRLGFTLSEIAEIIHKSSKGKTPCPMVRSIIQVRIGEIGSQLNELIALHERMKRALKLWKKMPDGVPDGHAICHLIESVDYK